MREVAEREGPWHSHNVFLGEGLWTLSGRTPAPDLRLRRALQLVDDLSSRPIDELRVLDVASEEGLFGIELARRGAEVLAIEGRDVNVARARFAKDALSLEAYEVIEDDVRNLNRDEHGQFDVVLCLGILYHLDAPDVFELVRAVRETCRGFALVDTWVSRRAETSREWRGHAYWGSSVPEHPPTSSSEERFRDLRMSLDNPDSFWLTQPSLYNLLLDVGFTSVLEARAPRAVPLPRDEVILAAIGGEPNEIAGIEGRWAVPWPRIPEREESGVHPSQTALGRLRRRLRSWVLRRR
jgi:SAM-dependent methyltransferase